MIVYDFPLPPFLDPCQVHRICFALSLFHLILSSTLIGVQDTRDKRAAIQNGCVLYLECINILLTF